MTGLLSTTPSTFALPGGADVRIWDTGHLANSLAETRIVAVHIPKGTLTPKVLTAPKIDVSRTPQALAAPVPNAVVVVNGSVFDPVRAAVPVESQIIGGTIRKSTRTLDSSVAIWGPGSHLEVINAQLSGTLRVGATTWTMAGLNWQSVPAGGVSIYNYTWGRSRHPAGPVSLVIAGGKVIAKRTGSNATLPPAPGQLVVTAPSGAYSTALSRVRVGLPAAVSYREIGTTVWDKYPHVKVAYPTGLIMAGSTLVKYGVNNVTSCVGRTEDLRPRTILGFLPNGDLLVVAIAGRGTVNGTRWGGASDHQAADYMLRLGARIAIKLDGGTSTTMLVRRTVGGPLVRIDRSGTEYQRPTPDSLAFLAP